MAYVICEECGGYYELQPGESSNDFENCECGGSLSCVDNIEVYTNPKYICSNCLKENYKGIFCSNCGGKLIKGNNDKFNNLIPDDESKMIEKLSNNSKNDVHEIPKDPKDLIKRISVLGVILGIGTFIILFITSIFVVFMLLTTFGPTKLTPSLDPFNVDVYFMFLIGIFFLIIVSGAIPTLFNKNKEYFDGALNGLIVGIICGISLYILFNFWDLAFMLFITITSLSGALGGLITIWLRK
jgi:hypothetical protein